MLGDITTRFVAFCESIKIKQTDLINLDFGSRQTINFIWNGKQKPTLKFLEMFLSKYQTLNARWLLTGEGEMLNTSKNYNSEPTIKQVVNEDEVCYKCYAKESQITLYENQLRVKDKHIEELNQIIGRLQNKLENKGNNKATG